MTRLIAILTAVSLLSGCAMMGGNVYPAQPDWAQEAWERQAAAGST